MKSHDQKCRPFGPQTFSKSFATTLTIVAIECRPFAPAPLFSSNQQYLLRSYGAQGKKNRGAINIQLLRSEAREEFSMIGQSIQRPADPPCQSFLQLSLRHTHPKFVTKAVSLRAAN